jgi:hypothetical protein
LQYSTIGYHQWRLIKGEHSDWDKPQGRALTELKIGVSQLLWVKNAALTYLGITQQCKHCSGEERSSAFHNSGLAARNLDLSSSSCTEDCFFEEKEPQNTKNKGKHRRILAQVQQASINPLPLPDPASNSMLVSAPPSPDYDDYYSAPLYNKISPALPNIWTFDNTGASIIPEVWVFWKDRGYRLHPQFSLAIASDDPIMHEDHFLPFSTSTISHENPQNEENAATKEVDSQVYGLQELLDEAGSMENTPESRGVFLCGKDRAGHFIQLNLEKDKVNLPSNQVQISPDIDSFIWITDKFSANSMDLHLNINFGAKPPFSVDNFITVSLIHPPADEEQRTHIPHRTKGNFKLSHIPHMEFGHSGQDHRRVNFIVFFPRMVWKDPLIKRYRTLLPKEVQDLWISAVVIPAFQKVFINDPGIAEYIPGSLQELRWRSGERKHHSVTLTTQDSITSLISNMKHNIAGNSALLGRYGSFFFAADARGIKLITKQAFQDNTSLELGNIFGDFGDLDWPYMLDRSKGELYLDLGLSFHSKSNIPLLGLWQLDKLHDSYGLMGTKKGVVHHFSTLGSYGGRKAAMKKERQQVSHLISRISYNLAFELVRNPGTEDYISSNMEAVKHSNKFIAGCHSWLHLFQKGMQRSYGVRDEIRGTAPAIQDLLKVALIKVW